MTSIKKNALLIMILTIIIKVFGFVRELVLAYFYGTSYVSDAYLISLTIPGVIFSFIGTGIATGFIPLYSSIIKKQSYDDGNRYLNNIINIMIILSTIIVILTLIFSTQIVKLFASGFEGVVLKLAVLFTRIFIFGIYFSGLIHIFTGFLQVNNHFLTPALAGVSFNIIVILSIYLSVIYDIKIIIIGTLIAKLSELLIMAPSIKMKKYQYEKIIDIKDDNIKQMLSLALPLIIGVSVNQINILVDRTLASRIAIGGISALNYANRLNLFIQGIFVMSIATVMYPMISKMVAENNMIGLKKSVLEAISSVNLLVLPATIGAMIFAEPIIRLLFGRGAFDTQAIFMTSHALFFYSIGMIGFGLREILSRSFYSMQDTKTPMINAAIAVVINIVLNIILSRYLGIGGLALATSISAIFCTVLLFISLRKKIGPFGLKNVFISFIKVSFASVLMGVIAKLSYDILLNYISSNLSLIIAISIGVLVYFAMISFMKIEEVDSMIRSIKRKLKK